MADWSVLRSTDLRTLYGQDVTSTYQQMMGDLTFSSSHADKSDENTFCRTDNVRDCIAFLNQELTVLGFQSLGYDDSSKETGLVNRLYEILRLYQRTGRVREELENRIHRISSELEHYQSLNMRLKTERDRLEREVAKEQEKCRQVFTRHKALNVKFKTEKDEVRRLQSVIKDRDAQYKHELKKKERELNKLKEKLHQLIADKTPNRRVGLDIANSLQRVDGRRSHWKSSTYDKQEEMYQLIIHNYEEKQRELMLENTNLRDCLVHMQKELSSVISRTESSTSLTIPSKSVADTSNSSEDDDAVFSDMNAVNNFSDGYFQMPYDLMRENLQKAFRETCKRIKENMNKPLKPNHQSSKSKSSPSKMSVTAKSDSRTKEEIEKLQKQISRYKEIIQEQEELIQESLQSSSKSVEDSFLHESVLLQEKESLSEQWRLFYQEKANFEDERRKCTETAIRLGKQRKALEDEKASILKNQFFQISPFKKTSSKNRTPQKGECTRLLPSTPIFSPAPSTHVKTPSTVELFRVLGLTPRDLLRRKESQPSEQSPSLKKASSTESLLSTSMSCNSAPGELGQASPSSSVLTFNDSTAKRTLFQRRSSTGSNEDLEV